MSMSVQMGCLTVRIYATYLMRCSAMVDTTSVGSELIFILSRTKCTEHVEWPPPRISCNDCL